MKGSRPSFSAWWLSAELRPDDSNDLAGQGQGALGLALVETTAGAS
jgi:hypothetical protein